MVRPQKYGEMHKKQRKNPPKSVDFDGFLEKEEDIDRSSNAVSIWNFRFQIEFFGFKVAVRRNNPGLERATSKKSLSGIHLVMRSECASRWSFLFGFNPSRGAPEPLSFEQLNLLHFFAPGSGVFERSNY